MLRRIILPVMLAVLAWGFWVSPEFKEIAAGVAIFLFGMMALEQGFKTFSGGVLARLLNACTDKVWKSQAFGFVSTAIMQSSSLVSVITISFLSAGLIALPAGIGIIFGANIGTTTGAWLVAGIGLKVKISIYAMPLIVFGVVLVFQQAKTLKGVGYILAGVGFLFLGIHYMKTGFQSFQDGFDLARYSLTGITGLLTYTGIGVLATVIMQSSHATLILGITALAAGQISYENSLAIAIGANVGTTITAILGAMSANVTGKRLAAAHLIFNVITGLIAILFINFMVQAVEMISSGLGIAPENYTLKFAVFHTLFNTIGVAIMTPFIPRLVTFLERAFPERALLVTEPYFLNEAALALPDTAMMAIVREAGHLYDNAFDFIATGLGLSSTALRGEEAVKDVIAEAGPPEDIDIDDLYARRIKSLLGAILEFATRAQPMMTPKQTRLVLSVRAAARDISQAVKDVKHLNKNMREYTGSETAEMRTQYNTMRQKIARILRETELMRHDPAVTGGKLKKLRKKMEADDILENGTLDELVNAGLISQRQASSLIHDSGYANNIGLRLIHAGRSIFRGKIYDLMQETGAAAAADVEIDEIEVEGDENGNGNGNGDMEIGERPVPSEKMLEPDSPVEPEAASVSEEPPAAPKPKPAKRKKPATAAAKAVAARSTKASTTTGKPKASAKPKAAAKTKTTGKTKVAKPKAASKAKRADHPAQPKSRG
ncbi:MAG: Na/Pi cotransporter family protein [Rhodospirillales bacterium]|jgi:phosphate:Na+ symporter|nr:Na/Pi cotransporter family protein [Rhodospirillales bacterium]